LFLAHYSSFQRQIFVRRIPFKDKCFNPIVCCVRPLHPHLVYCEEAFFDDGNLILLYEHCGKTTLKQLMRAKYEFDEKVVLCILYQVLVGLDFLHSHGLFHGNLSSSTIHIDETGKIKLSFKFKNFICEFFIRGLWIFLN
jgi:hypothetical protein